MSADETKRDQLSAQLTRAGRLSGVPDEDASVVGRAGEHVVVDRADGQTVHGVDVQEDVQSFPSARRESTFLLVSSIEAFFFYNEALMSRYFTHLSTS